MFSNFGLSDLGLGFRLPGSAPPQTVLGEVTDILAPGEMR